MNTVKVLVRGLVGVVLDFCTNLKYLIDMFYLSPIPRVFDNMMQRERFFVQMGLAIFPC